MEERKSWTKEAVIFLGIICLWPIFIFSFLGLLFSFDAPWTSIYPGDELTVTWLVAAPGVFILLTLIFRFLFRLHGLKFFLWLLFPLFIFGLMLVVLCYIENRPISLKEWQQLNSRPLVTRHLIKKHILLGKSSEEILSLLGPPDGVIDHWWVYENQLFYKDREKLMILFDGQHVSLVKLEP